MLKKLYSIIIFSIFLSLIYYALTFYNISFISSKLILHLYIIINALSLILIYFYLKKYFVKLTPDDANKQQNIKEGFSKENTDKLISTDIENKIQNQLYNKLKNISESDFTKYCEKLLYVTAKEYNIVSGLFYFKNTTDNVFRVISSYAFPFIEKPIEFTIGDGLSGQVAKNKKPIVLGNINNQYFSTFSGLGAGLPKHLAILPVLNHQNECIAIIELAAFKQFESDFEQISDEISKTFIEYLSIKNV